MDAIYMQQLDRIKSTSDNLFGQVQDRVQLIDSHLAQLRQNIERVRERISLITSDDQKGKATCLWSTSSYPMSPEDGLISKMEPVRVERTRGKQTPPIGGSEMTKFNHLLGSLAQNKSGGGDNSVGQQKVAQLLAELTKASAVGAQQAPGNMDTLNTITSASSLLVHYTYESRLVDTESVRDGRHLFVTDRARTIRSMTSGGSSLGGYNHPTRSTTRSRVTRAKQSAAEDGEEQHSRDPSSSVGLTTTTTTTSATSHRLATSAELGPAPASILRHHQESLIEPDMLESLTDMLNLDAASSLGGGGNSSLSNLLTSDLPDLLPSLTGIVRDVTSKQQARPQQQSSSNQQAHMLHHLDHQDGPTQRTSTPTQDIFRPPPDLIPQANLACAPPPPPPPPPPPAGFFPEVVVVQEVKQVRTSELVTPDVIATPEETTVAAPEQPAAQAPSTGRGALLAEIRAAASKPKRRAAPAAFKRASVEPGEPTGGGGEGAHESGSGPTRRVIPPPAGADPRDSLLASIRQAAGKPAAIARSNKSPQQRSRPLERKARRASVGADENGQGDNQSGSVPTNASGGGGGGDLMFDLVSKLRARRDGISGKNLVAESPRVAAEPLDTIQQRVMTQVSSLIPEMSPGSRGGGGGASGGRALRRQLGGEDDDEDDDEEEDDDEQDDDWNA